jgi:hypothetical protein
MLLRFVFRLPIRIVWQSFSKGFSRTGTIVNTRHLRKIKREEGGIGLFSREQQKNTTPFQYSIQIAVGAVFIALGTMLFYQVGIVRTLEMRHYGSADIPVGMWLTASAFFVVGAFLAHAGVIFYLRRIKKRVSSSGRKSRREYHEG